VAKEVYMPTLVEPVVFRSNKHNVRIQINQARSETETPDAALHPDVKMAIFRDGVYQTDDPEIVDVLDKRTDVWRAEDPDADLKERFGPDEYDRLRARFAQPNAEATGSDEPSDTSEE